VNAILRQKLLILWVKTPDLKSEVGAWSIYDATGQERHTTGDSETPPYRSVFDAMKDGWRVIQLPQQFPAYPGMELTTSYLRFEYVLEKLEEISHENEEGSNG
jgi:hypothetical protein